MAPAAAARIIIIRIKAIDKSTIAIKITVAARVAVAATLAGITTAAIFEVAVVFDTLGDMQRRLELAVSACRSLRVV